MPPSRRRLPLSVDKSTSKLEQETKREKLVSYSFLGRVLFSSHIIFSAWQIFNGFGVDGCPEAKELATKLDLAKAHLTSRLGVTLSNIENVAQFGVLYLFSWNEEPPRGI